MTSKVLLNDLQTGDIILMSGTHAASTVIRWYTQSVVSHVGMVITREGVPMMTESAKVKRVGGKREDGVQLTELGKRLGHYRGEAWVRRWGWTDRAVSIDHRNRVAWDRYKALDNALYERNLAGLLGATGATGWRALSWVMRDKYYFCSEYLAALLDSMLMIEHINGRRPDQYTPADFWPGGNLAVCPGEVLLDPEPLPTGYLRDEGKA